MAEIPEDLLLQARALINQAVAEAAAQGPQAAPSLLTPQPPLQGVTVGVPLVQVTW